MRKFLISQMLLILFLLTSLAATSYGQGKFSQYYNKGIEYYKQGKYDQAGEQFKKALELKPNHVYAMYGLGNTYYCKAKYDEAVKIYMNAIKINPDYPKVHYSLSLAYSKLGMTRAAEKEKEIFRKLTRGEKSIVKTPTRKKSEAVREVKKDRVVKTKRKTLLQKKAIERKPKETKVQEEIIRELKKKPVERKSVKGDESQTIFKGYMKETKKVKPRVYVKKYKKKVYKTTARPWVYIKEKWSKSGINKILICTCGYIFATQMWLCVVAFFGLIIWKIRKKTE
ncbi:MAG: tetratricopeptide repeat protein [Candidatus Scalinduaceae bacterium]